MSPKARRIVGLTLIWLVGLALAASAVMKLGGWVGDSGDDSGFSTLTFPLGVVELASAVLLLIPLTQRLGLLLCTAYLGGAMATSIALMGLPEAIPAAVMQALLWTGATLITPDLLGPLLVRPAPAGQPIAAGSSSVAVKESP